MLPASPMTPSGTDDLPCFLGDSAPSLLLAKGELGARLVRAARLAAALHMAQTAALRNREAQVVPDAEAPR